ncbi:alpha/beta fold hydrolase [Pseudonocardia endophytica]|uniref:Pimeloyl-ACP methyl ester carboxylesterase n=1 Tax=Pseudonocardia endophytica TaxID=401976 RepID=A0A4R1HEH3_PSEEN|nr:alpha/beta hydrolase [Pseudonocardia endophytica]TCK19998.1 pimeloyl-ACP methyl ester carboxylesterase [Pseudonocardia endophytica]
MNRAAVLAAGTAGLGAAVAAYLHANTTGLEKAMAGVVAAGFREKRATVGGATLAYAEGPANGPRVVLLHGQTGTWEDHVRVLPRLAADHHVFVVDVPGHGGSDRLRAADYTNGRVAATLAGFVDDVVGGPVLLSGHSSGGVLAMTIAAERPELVGGLLLEDPPLFSSEMPRLLDTTGGFPLVLAERFLAEGGPGEFARYVVEHGRYFEFFGPLEEPIRRYALRWMAAHPGEPLRIAFLPTQVNVLFQGLVHYDPAFGAAWVRETGGWYSDTDTEATLRAVAAPTTVIHTNFVEALRGTAYGSDGILKAAMDSDDLARAVALLPSGTDVVQLRCGHLVHFERPDEFVASLRALAARSRS